MIRIFTVLLLSVLTPIVALGQITFSPLDGPTGGYVSDIESNSLGDLFTVAKNSVYKSTDGGTSWLKLTSYPGVSASEIYIDNSDKIYVLNSTGVANSTNGGTTWTQVTASGTFQFARRLLKSESSGSLFAIGWNGSLYGLIRSSDDGATWTAVYTAAQVNDFTIETTVTPNHIYLVDAGANRVMRNTNNGNPLSWGQVISGAPAAAGVAIEVNKFNGYVYIFFYGANTYYSTNDATPSWTAIGSNPASLNYGDGSGDWKIYTSQNSDKWFILYIDDKNSVFSNNRLYKCTTQTATGGSWTELVNLSANSLINDVHTYGTSIWAGFYDEGILKSTNDGSSWDTGDGGITNPPITGLHYTSANRSLLAAYGSNRVTFSTDDPEYTIWTRKLTAGAMHSFVKLSGGNILAIGTQTFESANNGVSFSLKGTSPGTTALGKAHRYSDGAIYAIGSAVSCCPIVNNIYKTTNQGTLWSIPTITGLPANREITDISTTTNGDLYIGLVDNGTTFRIYKVSITTPTVANQLTISSFSQYYAIKAIGSKVYALGFGGGGRQIAISTDAGVNWTTKSSSIESSLFAVRDGLLFGVGSSAVFMSNDDGSTWQSIATLNGSNLIGVELNENFRAIVGLSNSAFLISNGAVILPNQPQNLGAKAVGSTEVYLQWEYTGLPNFPNFDDFIVERKLSTDANFSVISTNNYDQVKFSSNPGVTNFYISRDQTASENTNYVYRVKAVNQAGAKYSSELSVTTKNTCAPTIPDNRSWTGTVAGAASNTQINIRKIGSHKYSISDISANSLNVPPFNLANSMQSSFVTNCNEPYIGNTSVTGGNFFPNGIGSFNGTNTLVLNWQFRDNASPSNNYITKTITLTLNSPTLEPPPADPTNVAAFASSNTAATINWSPGNYHHEYFIERATNLAFTIGLTTVGTVAYPSTSIVDNGPLAQGTTYYYRVKAENIDNDVSGYSTPYALAFSKPNFILSGTTVSSTQASSFSAVWSDFDNDQDDDLVVTRLGFLSTIEEQPLFFKNNGAGDFQLTSSGEIGAYIAGVAGDYDNDGFADMFLGGFGSQINATLPKKNTLLKNSESFSFNSVGALPFSTPTSIAISATWVDVNNDKNLDLYIGYSPQPKLYLGNGAGGFIEKTGDPLVTDSYEPNTAIWSDYDNDGDQDVFIIDDNGVCRLYENSGGNFTRVLSTAFDADNTQDFFSAAWGDYDNDGDQDLYVTVNEDSPGPDLYNVLYKNNGNKTFTKQPIVANSPTENKGIRESQGCGWTDIDNDSDLDLIVSNAGGLSSIYLNSGTGTFTKAGAEFFTSASNIVSPAALAFADYDNNGFQDVAVTEFTFSESGATTAPTIKLLKNNNTNGNWIKIKLRGTTSNASAIGAKIILTANAKTQYREVQSMTGTGSQNSSVVHVGLGSATSVNSLLIKWPSGINQTVPVSGVNQLLTVIEDGAAPQIVTRNPSSNATLVPLDTKVEITFNEPPLAVTGKKITITPTGGTPIILDVSAGVIAGNKVTFTMPTALAAFTQHEVTLDAGAFTDIYSNATVVTSWTFQTIDITQPVIAFAVPATAPVTVDKGFASNKFTFTITDNSGTVSSATLSYRKIAGGAFTDLTGVLNTTSGKWEFTVLESFFDAMGIEYFITAKDPSNTTGRLPLDANTNFYLYLNYKGTDNIFPSDKIGFGGQKGNWKVISIPFELGSNNGVLAVFDEVQSLTNKVDWRILTYKDATAWGEFPSDFSTFTRGKGYFINIKNPISNINLPEASAPTNTRKNLFQMVLKKGWNQIGNPYLTAISWDDVKTFNSLTGTAAQLKQFESGAYTNNNALAPFAGGFVFVDNDVTVSIPFAGQTSSGGRTKGEGKVDKDNWILPITLKQNEIENTFGGVGMKANAAWSFDQFDDINPPRFFDYLEMNFDHPEHFAKHFSRDIVPAQPEYTWEFTINSNLEGAAELRWPAPAFGESKMQLFLLDATRQVLINMNDNASYTFDAQLPGKFKIYYGENLEGRVTPNRVMLGQATPNPTTGSTSISFTLPQYNGKYMVNLEVFDLLGRKIATVAEGEFAPGFYQRQWNDTEGLTDGLYTYRLSVAAGKKREVLGGRVILKR